MTLAVGAKSIEKKCEIQCFNGDQDNKNNLLIEVKVIYNNQYLV